jgi:hypothetical protein
MDRAARNARVHDQCPSRQCPGQAHCRQGVRLRMGLQGTCRREIASRTTNRCCRGGAISRCQCPLHRPVSFRYFGNSWRSVATSRYRPRIASRSKNGHPTSHSVARCRAQPQTRSYVGMLPQQKASSKIDRPKNAEWPLTAPNARPGYVSSFAFDCPPRAIHGENTGTAYGRGRSCCDRGRRSWVDHAFERSGGRSSAGSARPWAISR